jgi:predicted dehydrogenase
MCVWRAGSDVVDHQTVTMELEDGATVTLVMHGHSHAEERTMRYDGTRATLRGVFGVSQEIEVIDHATGRVERVPLDGAVGGHGGGDEGMMRSFLTALAQGRSGPTDAETSLESHLLAFSAETARVTGRTIDMRDVRGEAR